MKIFKNKFAVLSTMLAVASIVMLAIYLWDKRSQSEVVKAFRPISMSRSTSKDKKISSTRIPKKGSESADVKYEVKEDKKSTAWETYLKRSEPIRSAYLQKSGNCDLVFEDEYFVDQENINNLFNEDSGFDSFLRALNAPYTSIPSSESMVSELLEQNVKYDVHQVRGFILDLKPCESEDLTTYFDLAFEVLPKKQWFMKLSDENVNHILGSILPRLKFTVPFNENLMRTARLLLLLDQAGKIPDDFKTELYRLNRKVVATRSSISMSTKIPSGEFIDENGFRTAWDNNIFLRREIVTFLQNLQDQFNVQPID